MVQISKSKQDQKRGPKKPRKATLKSLENAAIFYLQRYASSAENLRRVLLRRVERSAEAHETDRDEGADFVDDIVRRYVAAGMVDDRAYAEARARAFHRRGLSSRAIGQRLRQKGVGDGDIEAAVAALGDGEGNVELQAAINLARRRRLGPYRVRNISDEQSLKDLAALARAGFSYAVAKRVIDAESIELIEAMIEA